jgi:hypothetical protein
MKTEIVTVVDKVKQNFRRIYRLAEYPTNI